MALLVIDVQAGMFQEADPVYGGPQLLARVGQLIVRARAASVPVIYVQHDGRPGTFLAPGTAGWEIHPAIAPLEGDLVIRKRTPDAFYETPLQEALAMRGIQRLVLAGIQTEICVDTTCRSAFSRGYAVTLAEDAHSTWDSLDLTAPQIIAHHNGILGGWFARLKPAAEVEFGG